MKISKQLLAVVLYTMFVVTWSHAQNFEWAKQMGGVDPDGGRSITVDASGNVYTTGNFQGTVDFDPGAGTTNLTSAGSWDIFISKLDASGNFVWVKQMGGTNDDQGLSIVADASGDIYTTGYFAGTVDFDPGPGTTNLTSSGNGDIFISKLDDSGNFIWAKQMGGITTDRGTSITVDTSGNVYSSGYFGGVADFDPGAGTANLTTSGSWDIFISKLDASGNFVWVKQMGGTSDDQVTSLALDASGKIYTTGFFQGTADFDPGVGTVNLTSVGIYDVFISKLDASGNFVWVKQMGGVDNDIGQSIVVDTSGNVYTTGEFKGTVDFDPGAGTSNLTSAGNFDIFISKLDDSGNFLWVKQMGGISDDRGLSISIDALGDIYTTGYFSVIVDFDPGPGTTNLSSVGAWDIFISKLDLSGDFVWAKQMGGISLDAGYSIIIDAAGNVYTTGVFHETADFDPGVGTAVATSVGSMDIFIQKLSQCILATSNLSMTECTDYTVPSGDETYSTVGTYNVLDTIPRACGADSVLIISVTILPELTGIHNETVCYGDSIVVNGTTYDASNLTGSEVFNNIGAYNCDSTVMVILTMLPELTGIHSETVCYGDSILVNGTTYDETNLTGSEVFNNIGAYNCDSTVVVILTVLPPIDVTVANVSPILTANQIGAIYSWLDCENNYAILSGETNQSYTATVTGNYAVEVTINGCVDTSACFLVDYTGIEEISNTKKELVKIIDFIGRETELKPNTPLIFIYSDGTRERVMKIEY